MILSEAKFAAFFMVIIVVFSSCVHERSVVKVDELVGTWKLKSFKLKKNDTWSNWRENPHGILIYSKEGYMSVSINSENKDRDWIDTILFYSGTYKIENDIVVHYVTNATDPKRIHKKMVRKLSGNEDGSLIKLSASGHFGEAILEWEKILLKH